MNQPGNTDTKRFFTWPVILCIALVSVVLWWFYDHLTGYGIGKRSSLFVWLNYHLNDANNHMEHGWLVPILSLVMFFSVREKLEATVKRIDWKGLLLVLFGALIYVAGYRVNQTRIPLGALPLIILGCIWFMAGFRVARICLVPTLFLWLIIPVPTLQQATTSLQLIATQMGHWGAYLFGVDTYVQGTAIYSSHNSWDAYSVSGGCSGMRSLMALVMISIVWAFIAKLSWWKKLILVTSSIPLAILGNAFRIISIVVIAEYIDPDFAGRTWHDWAGLLLFFPITLGCLMLIHSLLAGEWVIFGKKRKQVVIRKAHEATPPPATGNTREEEQ